MPRPKRSAATRSAEKVKQLFDVSNLQIDDEEELHSASDLSDIAFESSSECSSDDSEEDTPPTCKSKPSKRKQTRVEINLNHSMDQDEYADDDDDFMAAIDRLGAEDLPVFDFPELSVPISSKPKPYKLKKAKNPEKPKLEWEHWIQNELQDVHLVACSDKSSMETADPPPELLLPLLPFQKEWLWWSLRQETSETRGGILADEMGMGKTIQAISLIVTSRARSFLHSKSSVPSTNAEKSTSSTSDEVPQLKGTLVVCPVVAIIQWRNEVVKCTKPGTVKVLIYHGTKRSKDIAELKEADIVLTTYSTIESEYRNNVSPAKIRCNWCAKLFYPDRLKVHQNHFCGPHARKTEKQAKQLKKKAPGTQKSFSAKNSNKKLQKGKIKGNMTTFSSDEEEDAYKKSSVRGGKKRKILELDINLAADAFESLNAVKDAPSLNGSLKSLLHGVRWNRVILDEAHFIKDRKCSTAKSVLALRSNFKWALSGTPLQNRVGELYSLVRFLEIDPYSYYYCKSCDCKSLDYSYGKCNQCQHSTMSHFCWWNKFIANPIKKYGYSGEGHRAMQILKHKLLSHVLLRRTKLERAQDLALPPSTKLLRRDYFDTREEDFYQALYTQSQSQFNTYVDSGTLLNNYAHIFDLLTRLRQAVDHPYLVVYSKTASSNSTPVAAQADAATVNEVCSICSDCFEEPFTTACDHTFCKSCIMEYASAAVQSPPCPVCGTPLTIDFTSSSKPSPGSKQGSKIKGYKSSSILNRIDLTQFQTSTKIDALREEIEEMLESDATAKAIVFSQFTSFLELIGFRLEKLGVKCVKLDGSMNIAARDQMIERFTKDSDCKVFLMSLKAGGVALNLTVASHVFLMDPWWNPAVERQAQDRIHRLGQYKPIKIVRFIIENTIEERILKLQEKKELVFEGTVGGSSEALGKLTEQDLRFLFTS